MFEALGQAFEMMVLEENFKLVFCGTDGAGETCTWRRYGTGMRKDGVWSGSKELLAAAELWNLRIVGSINCTGVDVLDRDSPQLQLSRIADGSFQSANLVPYPALVTVGDLPLGLPVSMSFTLRRFRTLELACGGLVTLNAMRLVSTLGLETLFVLWSWILRPCL